MISIKSAIKTSPYALVYGKRLVLPIHIELPELKILQEIEDHDFEPLQSRYNQLLKLEEDRNKPYDSFQHTYHILKKWFDKKKSSRMKFELGDIILKWDEERENIGRHQKFDSLWSGPYIITQAMQNNMFKLQYIIG